MSNPHNVRPLRPLKILLVEDSPGDARLLGVMLSGTSAYRFEVSHAWNIDEAVSLMASQSFDAMLLDLNLPDSRGMDTLDAMRGRDPLRQTAIIVVTGNQRPEQGLESVRHGAEDFLNKNELNADTLSRAIRFAVERVQLRRGIDAAEAEISQAREARTLEAMAQRPPARSGRLVQVAQRLACAYPQTFAALAEAYRALVGEAIRQRDAPDGNRDLAGVRDLIERLMESGASPRDIADLHRDCLTMLLAKGDVAAGVVEDEARLLLIELMGWLAASYREDLMEISSAQGCPREPRERRGA